MVSQPFEFFDYIPETKTLTPARPKVIKVIPYVPICNFCQIGRHDLCTTSAYNTAIRKTVECECKTLHEYLS